MRIWWKCSFCNRKHYHPTTKKMSDERQPIRAHQRMFDTEYCVEAFVKVRDNVARGVAHA